MRFQCFVAIALLIAVSFPAHGQTDAPERPGGFWPQWRGSARDNRSTDTGLMQSWPVGGPPLAWHVKGLGDSISPVTVAGGRVLTTTTYGDNEYGLALAERTGELLWRVRIGPANPENRIMRSVAQRTPTIDGERAYFFTTGGILICLEAASGLEIWRCDYTESFGSKMGTWGWCDRPFVDGDSIITCPGGATATVARLN